MRSRVSIAALDGSIHLRYETQAIHLEAPNWTHDGRLLIVNGDGVLWRLPVDGGEPEPITHRRRSETQQRPRARTRRRHDLRVGERLAHLRAPLVGGTAKRITADDRSDCTSCTASARTARTRLRRPRARRRELVGAREHIHVPSAGGAERRLTNGTGPADGREYSPDGEWIYFNTEAFRRRRPRPDRPHAP